MTADGVRGLRDERGQALVLSIVFLTVLLGMSALVLDVGSWYRAHRAAQATADAAALAAAQELPLTSAATNTALDYASKNGGGLVAGDVTYSSNVTANDTVSVHVRRPAPTFFAKLFGINSVDVSGRATARSELASKVKFVAPIVVHYTHPLLNCGTTSTGTPVCDPTYGQTTTLDLEDLHSPGGGNGSAAFGLMNLNQASGGNIGAGTLANWLTKGYGDYLGTGIYNQAPSANFNNSQFLAALNSVIGKEILFPVYRVLMGPGSNATYEIIGWVGFVITSYTATGSTGTLTGYFTQTFVDGVQETSSGQVPDLGARKVELVG